MIIFRKFEQLGYEISEEYLNAAYDIHSKEAIREIASLAFWLWRYNRIWIEIGNKDIFKFTWDFYIGRKIHYDNKSYESPEEAYMAAFDAVYNAHDFIQHQQTKQL